MKFSRPTQTGIILRRYKRFLADIRLDDGQEVVAHVPNTGSMKSCWEPGQQVLCSVHDNPKRKLKHTLEMVHNGSSWIMVNTSRTNAQAREAIEGGRIGELSGFSRLRSEVKVGGSRMDMVLAYPDAADCFVEVKNVTLLEDGLALFPDAVSVRGQKHLRELIRLKGEGMRACMLYLINREDAQGFAPADAIDAEYGSLLRQAASAGVELLPYRARLSPVDVAVGEKLPLIW